MNEGSTSSVDLMPDDRELVTLSQAGDMQAFSELVTRHRQRAYAMVYQIVRNEQDAWDVAQEGFVKAWKALPRFKNDAGFYTWLYRIMTNTAIDWVRKKANRPSMAYEDAIAQDDSAQLPTARIEGPEGAMRNLEIKERIDAALDELSPEHRAVITLKEVEGLSYNEIAEAVGCSIGTVMSRIHYARKHLQSLLSDIYHEKL